MRVGIDLTALLPQHTGVDKYLVGLAFSLAELDPETSYLLFVNREDRGLFDGGAGERLPRNFRVLGLSTRPRPVRFLFQQAIQPAILRAFGVDVLHSPSFLMPAIRAGSRHLLTVHDMTSFTHPECHVPLRRSAPYKRAIVHGIRTADLVSVPSPSVRRDILDLVDGLDGDRVRVIPAGVDARFEPRRPEDTSTRVRRLGIEWPYVLFVGTVEPRKNVARLVAAFERVVARGDVAEHLVIAGAPGWGAPAVVERLRTSPARDRVHMLGYVADPDLPWLYAGASAFAYPSLSEGFGFPPLEAMASGVPVVTSLSSSLADNLAGAAELVQPDDVEGLADALWRLLRDAELRRRRIEQGTERAAAFRWDSFARRTLDCYRELAEHRPLQGSSGTGRRDGTSPASGATTPPGRATWA